MHLRTVVERFPHGLARARRQDEKFGARFFAVCAAGHDADLDLARGARVAHAVLGSERVGRLDHAYRVLEEIVRAHGHVPTRVQVT